jgi:ATP-dependent DNA helicase RecQ
MGVNKPNVRWVIHHDLPKNIEGYYQETGRAGRDGLPAECLLLYSAGDAAKQRHFIDEITGKRERQVATAQLRQILHFAEDAGCRRAELLRYFGESFGVDNCGACDNCLEPRETYDGTLDAQKLLSCVYRIRRASGFGVGLNHIADVLTGAEGEKIRRWEHDRLSTFGIGRDRSRGDWVATGRELLRLAVEDGPFATLALTAEGLRVLTERKPVQLTKPLPSLKARRLARSSSPEDGPYDEILFERLRALRKRLADERSVPAYVILGDATLRAMARRYPTRPEDLRGLPGIGEKKYADFAEVFSAEIARYLETNARVAFTGTGR